MQLSPTPSGEAQKAYGFMVKKMQRITYNIENDIPFVMEATGNYHVPIALALQGARFYVSIVNAILVHDYGNNSLRRAKTDKKDAIKLANYGLDHWLTLPRYVPEEDTRMMLKTCYRQYQQYSKVQTILKNNLISLLDTTFPSINRLFNSPIRSDGREKWLDFVDTFWHCECVSKLSENAFSAKYQNMSMHTWDFFFIVLRLVPSWNEPLLFAIQLRKGQNPNWSPPFLRG